MIAAAEKWSIFKCLASEQTFSLQVKYGIKMYDRHDQIYYIP